MSRIYFVPAPDTDYENDWPKKIIGDGFIDLKLYDAYLTTDSALYRDNFREEYEVFNKRNGEWWIEVREDG